MMLCGRVCWFPKLWLKTMSNHVVKVKSERTRKIPGRLVLDVGGGTGRKYRFQAPDTSV